MKPSVPYVLGGMLFACAAVFMLLTSDLVLRAIISIVVCFLAAGAFWARAVFEWRGTRSDASRENRRDAAEAAELN